MGNEEHECASSISIHALRKESDNSLVVASRTKPISIHALRKESDHDNTQTHNPTHTFQSTLSVRRATPRAKPSVRRSIYFNPRSP